MAEPVWLSGANKLVTAGGPIARSSLSPDDELFFVERVTDQITTSTTYVNVVGVAGTLVVPEGPFMIEASIPLLVEESGQYAEVQIVAGASTLIVGDRFRAGAATEVRLVNLRARIPFSMHSPAVGSEQTYQVQFRTSAATSDATVFPELFGPRLNPCYIQARRL